MMVDHIDNLQDFVLLLQNCGICLIEPFSVVFSNAVLSFLSKPIPRPLISSLFTLKKKKYIFWFQLLTNLFGS